MKDHTCVHMPDVDNIQETNSEIGQVLSYTNKKTLLLIKEGIRVGVGLKKE
jgi:hypothetical protein